MVLRSLPAAVVELEGGRVGVEVGVQLEEALVDAAEFLGAEVLVVDGAARAVLGGEGERADGGEQRAVGELAGVEVGGGALGEEEAAERGQRDVGRAFVAEPAPDALEGLVLVGVAAAGDGVGQVAQALGAVVGVAAFGVVAGVGRVEQVAVLGGEQHEQAVDDA